MLIGHEEFLGEVMDTRLVWIQGNLRSHKTSLAFRLALEIIKRQDLFEGMNKILSNCSSIVNEDDYLNIPFRDGLYLDAVIIYDEAGKFISGEDGTRVAKILTQDVGKANTIVLMPSKSYINNNAWNMLVYRLKSFENYGIPLLIYEWQSFVAKGVKGRSGKFAWLGMSEVYGLYNSQERVNDDGGLWLVLEKINKMGLKRNKYQTLPGGKSASIEVDDLQEFTNAVVAKKRW